MNSSKNKKKTKKQSHMKLVENGKSERKIRYAVAGLGYIAQAAVLPAFKHAKNSELTALISSDPEKLKKLGKEYNVANLYSAARFSEACRSGTFDAVYIALPNNLHHPYTILAAEAGIHVLCEKPMALNPQECEQMIQACEDNGVKLMIAYRLHFDPANLEAIEIARSGKIGTPKVFSSVFSFTIKDKNNIRLKSELGGGPVFDLGIYCINAARHLFQKEPVEVSAVLTSTEPEFSEVEEAATVLLRFPEGQLAQFICSYGISDASHFELIGDKGTLCLDPAYEIFDSLEHEITVGEKTKRKKFPKSDQFAPELVYFSECILKNRDPEPNGLEGLLDVAILCAVHESAQRGRAMELRLPEKKQPGKKLAMRFKPFEKPTLVNAEEPAA